jgi:hypothetical protein
MKRDLHITQRNFLVISLLAIALFLFGCSGSNQEELTNSSRLIISLVDSPAEYRAVNVDIQEISIKTNGTTINNGWILLDKFNPGVYNILEFTGGQELPLADMDFPAGIITQIKLKLGKNNTLEIGDHISTLLPAGGTSDGFIYNVNETISAGGTFYYRLDFDAAKSVSKLGASGQMILKPVLKLLSESKTGSILGDVKPAHKHILVNVIANNKIIASSYAPENSSKFFIPGIESGIYDISIESGDDGYQKYIRDIQVTIGNVTDLGQIQFGDDD